MKTKRSVGAMKDLKGTSNVSQKLLAFKHREGVNPMQHKLCGFVEIVLSPSKDPYLPLASDLDVCDTPLACPAALSDDRAGARLHVEDGNKSSSQICCLNSPEVLTAGSLESDRKFESNSIALQNPKDQLDGLSSSNLSRIKIFEKIEQLVGKECWLSEERPEVCVQFESGAPFTLIPPNSKQFCPENMAKESGSEDMTGIAALDQGISTCCGVEEACLKTSSTMHHALFKGFTSSVSIAGKFQKTSRVGLQKPLKCRNNDEKKNSVGKTCIEAGTIVRQLYRLSVQNKVRVQGRIIKVVQKSSCIRIVTLLDVYLPSALWSVHNYWKPGTVAASCLSHVRCDWDHRQKVCEMAMNGNRGNTDHDISVWDVGECHVLDCKSHYDYSKVKYDEFNLHKVFKSLPSFEKLTAPGTCIQQDSITTQSYGLQHLSDDILSSIFSQLQPRDLNSIASTCRHTRFLARNIMPCLNLKLFPHQQAAVCWMLQRETNPQSFKNPLYKTLQTEDGFFLFLNCISGELSNEMPPEVMDFRGGFFCDEPGLGKTVTALSLILRNQGKLAEPPPGVQVRWCERNPGEKLGYYELNLDVYSESLGLSMLKRCNASKSEELDTPNTGAVYFDDFSEDDIPLSRLLPRFRKKLFPPSKVGLSSSDRPNSTSGELSRSANNSGHTQSLSSSRKVKRNLFDSFGEVVPCMPDPGENSWKHVPGSPVFKKRRSISHVRHSACKTPLASSLKIGGSKSTKNKSENSEEKEFWAQCDACKKWRKLPTDMPPPIDGLAWFCIMNKDVAHQSCSIPQEKWNRNESIQHLPGFRKKWMISGQDQNVTFFMNVLKDHAEFLNSEAIKALNWLADLTTNNLAEMANRGVSVPPTLRLVSVSGQDDHHYDKLFHSFGLVQTVEVNKVATWRYPDGLDELVFDSHALKIALSKPIKRVTCLYLSKATLIVVPANLVEHWENQILKHTRPGQLNVYVWNDQKRPPLAHTMAWDYDIVITTFPRLSAEWSSRKDSILMHVHWSRIILDEGHTLGSSMSLTNKLQMAISMHACFRWVLTGTPMPNTPNSQLAHLYPLLKFLHEAVYGKNQRWWDLGILRPFEARQEDGRARLLQLLQRSMISARKSDLHSIPPCIRKVKLLDFTVKHAASYNELVETVRRNILLADWNDPDHVESLLNPRQWKFRSSTLKNVRLSCCVAGHIKMRNAGEDIQETMDILVQQGMDPLSSDFAVTKMALLDGGNCNRCNQWCRLPILTPCRHLLCFSCVAMDCTKCNMPGCQHAYKMQSPKDSARPENPNPKWPVPQDLIELQPSYVQDDWHSEWHATSSSKVAYLVEQLKLLQGLSCQGLSALSGYHIGNHLSKRHCFRYNVKENKDTSYQVGCQECINKDVPEKAIVFSQFLEHIHVVEKQLTEAGIRYVGMYSPMQSTNKMFSLLTFKNDPSCTVLLMDGSAALGLDLSFVTRVYLMEPIWDRSMEEQVVSRAHRMGATRPILVETLAMRGTIEAQMLEFLQDCHAHESAQNHGLKGNKKQHTWQHTSHDPAESWYLEHLSFVRTNHCESES